MQQQSTLPIYTKNIAANNVKTVLCLIYRDLIVVSYQTNLHKLRVVKKGTQGSYTASSLNKIFLDYVQIIRVTTCLPK